MARHPQPPGPRPGVRHPVMLGVAITLVAANLRPALAAVGPVLDEVRADLGLSGTEAALLTAVPVICLGALAPTALLFARRRGIEPVVAMALMTIVAGLLLRVAAGRAVLFAGTILVSGAIAVANVLLPALIKRDFGGHSGVMTGVYTMALSGSAAVAAGVTVPIGDLLGHGWRGALGVWTLPVLLALLVWMPLARVHTAPPSGPSAGRSPVRDPLAWQVTLFFGLQALSFYAVLAWLPSIYQDHGYSPADAGLLLSVSAFVQIPVTLLLPHFAARAADQRAYAAGCTVLTAAGLAGVLVAPTAAPWLWVIILGAGQGGMFAVALLMFVLRARTADDTARLSAMAQTFGYIVAGAGPLLVGTVHDATASWTPAVSVLLALLVPQLVFALLAGRRRRIGADRVDRVDPAATP